MRSYAKSILAVALAIGLAGCGNTGPPASAVSKSLQVTIASLDSTRAVVHGVRLLEPRAVARFYKARRLRSAWGRGRAEDVVQGIRDVERDGLTPEHYHLTVVEALLRDRKEKEDAALEADLDILLSDAVAAIIDDVRHGKVRPRSLDPRWNVNPREGAPPLEGRLAQVAGARNVREAMQAARPDHFIYKGLVGALAKLREVAAEGGWSRVPAGKPIKPGTRDRRLPAIRARLAATGELDAAASRDSSMQYDGRLQEAVRLFQARHRLEPNAVIDKDAIDAMNVPASQRVAQVRVNLERARWVLGGLKADFLLVNLPAFKAYLIRGGRNVWETRTQIGEEARETPAFRSEIRTIEFNPDWVVPPTILREDIIKGIQKGEDMIAKKRLTAIDREGNEVDPYSIDWGSASAEDFPYTLRQPPGPGSALGQVKFLFPNRFSIYLHDTPHGELFEAEKRTFSSGCIRVEHALDLAEILLTGQGDWTRAKIEQVIATDETQTVPVKTPLPILIVYWTVSVGASGEVRYMRDIYDRDAPVLAALDGTPQAA